MSSGSKITRRSFFRQTLAAGGVTLFIYANGRYRMTFANTGVVNYKLRIVHTNDHHARIEPEPGVTIRSTPAPSVTRDLGGVARRKVLIDQKKAQAGVNGEEFLLIDAGDVFQGTLYFTLFNGQADLEFYNDMGYEAMAIGNHEFDRGQQPLVDFIKNANFPVISANVIADPSSLLGAIKTDVADPAADKWGKRVIITKGAKKIGLFGLTPPDTGILSSPGAGVTFDTDLAGIAQAQINALKTEGADIVIGLTHIGYDADVALVPLVSGLSAIVGGHSHTPLRPNGDTTPAGGPPVGPYPTIINDKDGKPVPIVTDWEWGKWLGDITLGFDDVTGAVSVITGSVDPVWAGGLGTPPRALIPGEGAEITPDPTFQNIINTKYKPQVDALRGQKIGSTSVVLNGVRADARTREINLGNLIADAIIEKAKPLGAQLAITNGGGIRTSIPVGDVSIGQVLDVLPFGNTIALVTLTGAQVIQALENGVSQVNFAIPGNSAGRFPQVGGMRFIWDALKPVGSRIMAVHVMTTPTNAQSADAAQAFTPINLSATYVVATNNFMLTGGDGYTVFTQGTSKLDTGFVMADVVGAYITAKSPVTQGTEGRITRVQAYYPFLARDTATTTITSTLVMR